ncbi:hypothetical protein JKP88DRAFT_236572 [Tribonema minus]|uniref:Uncharacterized protein n=1 Tax=Tribonema minus TaxID=303371 RepID=A0A835Z410_9STRA|nr:hypothetical protein JKP88DRAFT_236572 [Tribonema minus]
MTRAGRQSAAISATCTSVRAASPSIPIPAGENSTQEDVFQIASGLRCLSLSRTWGLDTSAHMTSVSGKSLLYSSHVRLQLSTAKTTCTSTSAARANSCNPLCTPPIPQHNSATRSRLLSERPASASDASLVCLGALGAQLVAALLQLVVGPLGGLQALDAVLVPFRALLAVLPELVLSTKVLVAPEALVAAGSPGLVALGLGRLLGRLGGSHRRSPRVALVRSVHSGAAAHGASLGLGALVDDSERHALPLSCLFEVALEVCELLGTHGFVKVLGAVDHGVPVFKYKALLAEVLAKGLRHAVGEVRLEHGDVDDRALGSGALRSME